MELNQYLTMFIDESRDHLQAMNENLLGLENNPEDISIVQNIFRSAHTLKGMSATMGFEDLASLTHEMENVLDLVRNHKLQMNPFIFDTLFKSLDSLESMVQDIIDGGTGKADVQGIVVALKSIVKGDYNEVAAAIQADASPSIELDEFQRSIIEQSIQSGYAVYFIEIVIQKSCVLKAARAYMVFDILERNGELVKSSPSVQEIEQEQFENSFSLFFITQIDQASLEKQIMNVSEIESVRVAGFDQDSINQLSKASVANMETKTQNAYAGAQNQVSSDEQTEEKQVKPKGEAKPASAPVANKTIRVDIERLDVLINLFSELLIDRGRLEQLAGEVMRTDLTETVEHMSRISGDLQNVLLKLRMVPVDSVFNRFPRMIRDLAKSLDKKVELVISGAETELDRTVIDEIGDPLVHLLRNALDHGIEPVQDRIAAGKPETGTIYLRAFHSGNSVFIEIEEDGRGINREKVIQIAVKNGILTSEQALKLTDEQVYELIFAPGFSTADKISDISGRGVGLDVVKTKIYSLGGNVTIESKWGKGTKFSVQLPLTLSIISAMLVRVGQEKYAIPLSSIVETMIVQNSGIRNVYGTRMIDYRNSVIPIVPLASIFDCPSSDQTNSDEYEAVIIKKGDKMVALIVEGLIGQQEIVLKSLGKYLTNLFAISGATILGDGQVALIMDPNAIIK